MAKNCMRWFARRLLFSKCCDTVNCDRGQCPDMTEIRVCRCSVETAGFKPGQ